MSSEVDTRKLLKIRNDLEERTEQLQIELEDLKTAMSEVDKAIVGQGFHKPMLQPELSKPVKPKSEARSTEVKSYEMKNSEQSQGSSIQAKDGTILGKVQVTENILTFIPREGLNFTVSIPPWQSFLIDRVLANMKTTDEARATTGEITPEQILSYQVEMDSELIKSLTIRNYGSDRRLREIQSSLRWSLDKMYDKMRRG